MTDMGAIRNLIDLLELEPGQWVLDLGCGAGGISEYLSDHTGTQVTGVDYSKMAISTALARTEAKRTRLRFQQADLNTLALPPTSFDAVISVDSIYWVDDVSEMLKRVVHSSKPGGRMAILIVHLLEYCDVPEALEIDKTYIASALDGLEHTYQSRDLSDAFEGFWPTVRESILALKDDFEREGNGYICEHWLKEANGEFIPALEAGELRRYLYLARV